MLKIPYSTPFLSYAAQLALLKSIYFLKIVDPNHTFKPKLESLFLKYPNVDRKAMGYSINWRSEVLW